MEVAELQLPFHLLRNFIYPNSDGAVACDVASCAETIHGDIEGYHQGLQGFAKAQHALQYA